MDFRTFTQVLRLHWKLVTAALLACLLGSVAITVVQNRRYQAAATILVSFSGQTDLNSVYQATMATQERLSSYAVIAAGQMIAERALKELHDPMSPDRLVSQTEVTYTPKSLLLTVSVTADVEPRRVAALAGAIADQFVAILPTLGLGPQQNNRSAPTVHPLAQELPAPRADDPTSSDAGSSGQPPEAAPLSDPAGAQSPAGGEEASPAQVTAWQPPLPIATATVVERPGVPETPVSPVPSRNIALGLIAGLVLGVGAALSRQATDHIVRDRRKLEQLSGLPTLAELPGRRGGTLRFGTDHTFDEAMRNFRTRLLKVLGPETHRVLVAAPFGGEGTTTTALNLALAFTELGDRVVLVEGDSRQSVIAGLMDIKSGVALSDLLADRTKVTDAVRKTSTEGLFVVAARKARHTATLPQGNDLPEVLEKVCSPFDRAVIDGPAVLATASVGLLAGAVQTTVLVVRAGRTTIDEVNDALHALRSVGADVVGTVMTDARVPRHTKAASRTYRSKVGGLR